MRLSPQERDKMLIFVAAKLPRPERARCETERPRGNRA